MALYLKSTAIRFAARENGINGWATTSNSSPVAVERLRERIVSGGGAGAVGRVVTVDPGESVARSRLADPETGEVSGRMSIGRFGAGMGDDVDRNSVG